MNTKKDILDYTYVDSLNDEEQIELLEEKLGKGREIYFNCDYYTVYDDAETRYIIDPQIGLVIMSKSDNVEDDLLRLNTNDEEQSGYDGYKKLEDIYNSSLSSHLEYSKLIEFVKEVSKHNKLGWDFQCGKRDLRSYCLVSDDDEKLIIKDDRETELIKIDEYQTLDDIYDADFIDYLDDDEVIEFVKEVSKHNKLGWDIETVYEHFSDCYIVSDGEQRLKIDGHNIEYMDE